MNTRKKITTYFSFLFKSLEEEFYKRIGEDIPLSYLCILTYYATISKSFYSYSFFILYLINFNNFVDARKFCWTMFTSRLVLAFCICTSGCALSLGALYLKG